MNGELMKTDRVVEVVIQGFDSVFCGAGEEEGVVVVCVCVCVDVTLQSVVDAMRH